MAVVAVILNSLTQICRSRSVIYRRLRFLVQIIGYIMDQFSARDLIITYIIPNRAVIQHLNLGFFHGSCNAAKHKSDIAAFICAQICRIRTVSAVRVTASA